MGSMSDIKVEDINSFPTKADDILDDDDYSDMPDLCESGGGGGGASANSEKGLKSQLANELADDEDVGEKVKKGRGELGVWDDVLGSGRLQKRITLLGREGERPERGARVRLQIKERLAKQEEEEVMQAGGDWMELEFNVGESEVIQALDLVVPLMEVEEEAEVKASSDFCYGDQGDSGRSIPGKADLLLTIRLLSSRVLPPAPNIPLAERYAIGNEKRIRGNTWYSRGEHSMAVQCYRKAVEYLDDESIENELEAPIDRFLLPKEMQALLEDRVKTYNNMAQAQMKLTAWDSALASVRQVLKIEPNNEKALFRKAKILQEKCRTDEAIGILRRVTRLYPDNKPAQAELSSLLGKQRKGREKEQALSRKMLGMKEVDLAKQKDLSGKQTRLIIACIGGLGALVGAILARTYNIF